MTKGLNQRNWAKAEEDYFSNERRFVVFDEAIEPASFEALREGLLDHWGWRYKSLGARRLFLIEPKDLHIVYTVAQAFQDNLGRIFAGLELLTLFAVMHQEPERLGVHADNSVVSVNLWLTPDHFNMDSSTGGLVLFRKERVPDQLLHEYNDEQYAGQELTADDWESAATVPYRCNRATIFPGRTLHATQSVNFLNSCTEAYRMNLTMLYGVREEYLAQRAPYT